MKNYILNIFVILAICSCSVSKPENAEQVNELPPIYPDYIGVTIPVEIAPLDFDYNGGEFETMYVLAKGSKSGELEAGGTTIDFNVDDWHELTRQNQGGEISMTVYVKQEGKWKQYQDFKVFVSNHPLEEWGLTYRRIAPGYEVYGKLGLYQRDLSTFEETPIIENTYVAGACFNCHTSNRTNPDQFTFHVRGDHGATMVQQHGNREWLKARNDSLHGSMVYPYWHPSGKYCAYSTNQTHQSFHAVRGERIEVFDQASDVFVFNPNTHELLLDKRLMTPDHYETYPVFSPDGKTLYFCSSDAKPIPSEYKEIRYNICKIDFNAENGTYGEKIDTVFHASALGKSATHPRPSYDGKYLMFTLADYGCFPIWHNEADNYILNLQTGEAKPLTEANSPQTDSWHNWNVNSHWFVFTSRRGNGLYTRLYLAHIDDNGNVSKPFLLPQRNPAEYYDALIDSYNTPDFTAREVEFDTRSAAREISSDERITTKVK